VNTKKKAAKAAGKTAGKPVKKPKPSVIAKAKKAAATRHASSRAPVKKVSPKPAPAPKKTAPSPAKKIAKPQAVTAKKTPEKIKAEKTKPDVKTPASPQPAKSVAQGPAVAGGAHRSAPKATRTTIDDLALDVDEKDELLEQEKRDLAKALAQDEQEVEDEPLETAFVPTDTSERFILVVDEEGQRRNETVTIVQQILPNAVVEVADDPEEAAEVMQDCDFDTFVVNFLMPGFSASPFVKAVANHPDHPLLIGFAADKISDALDQRKGLKIIPLKRLFDLDVNAAAEPPKEKLGGLLED
jgi:PleD family two-component response regulator